MKRHWRMGAMSVALAAALTGTVLGGTSSAASTYCRTDPTISLSNGVAVQMWAQIDTDLSNVTSVSYVLHVPTGVTATGISYDSTGYLEHVQVVADMSGTKYSDVTTVQTSVPKIQVSANAIRRDGSTATKNGTSGTAITVNWAT
jgi:hypothetical protein